MIQEFQLIEKLQSWAPLSVRKKFRVGDDAAFLSLSGRRALVFSTDAVVENVDFLAHGRKAARPEEIGRKALAVNLSDIAAMGAKPLAFVTTWGISKGVSEKWILRVAKGIANLAARFKAAWVGGDISRSNQFFVSIAILGEAQRKEIVFRKGAQPGDFLYVTGTLGGSILGKHLSFVPRIREARYLVENFSPTAMIDLSDGFIQDLGHILTRSGVGAEIDLGKIPISQAARRQARGSRRQALQSALTDGEDFELLFTLRPTQAAWLEAGWKRKFPQVSLQKVGVIRRGAGKIVWHEKGRKLKGLWFQKRGFVHF